jgi:WD40 repeat protein
MDQNAEDEAIRRMLGASSFGKQDLAANVQAQIELCRRKKDIELEAKSNSKKKDKDSDDDSDGDSDDDYDEEDEFPISHDLVLKTHERPITSISLDQSAGRLITASTDCKLNFHDFASMTPTTLRAFKSVDPTATKDSVSSESHPIHQAIFSPHSSTQILVIPALPQAMIFSRDGEELVKFVKGDMYLRDLNNTKGHISEITTGCWSPDDRNLCVTAGTDGTLRIWDVNMKYKQRDVIVFKSKVAGSAGRSRMTAVAWASQAQGSQNLLVSAALDGTLVMYNGNGPFSRPLGEVRDAHQPGTWTSGLSISADGRLIVSRGGDDTIKLWDTRKFKQPISTASYPSISSQYPNANIQFSPSSTSIVFGTGDGELVILNPALRPEISTKITGTAITTVHWNEKLNQIITGTANGEVHVLFNPSKSNAGAMTVLSKLPKKRYIDDDPNLTTDIAQGYSGESIITPGGILPPPDQGGTSKKAKDPRRPHMPAHTPFAKNAPSEHHIMHNVPLSSMRDEDPREALLKYADKANKDPLFTKAWQQTQPETIYSNIEEEEQEPDKKKLKR